MKRVILVALLILPAPLLAAGGGMPWTEGTCAHFTFNDPENGATTKNAVGGPAAAITGDVIRVPNGLVSGSGLLLAYTGAYGVATVNPPPVYLPTGNSRRLIEFAIKTTSPLADTQTVLFWNNGAEQIRFYNPGKACSSARLQWDSRGNTVVGWNAFGGVTVRSADVVGISSGEVSYFGLYYDGANGATVYKYVDGHFSTAAFKTSPTLISQNLQNYPMEIGCTIQNTAAKVVGWQDDVRISTPPVPITRAMMDDRAAKVFGKRRPRSQ